MHLSFNNKEEEKAMKSLRVLILTLAISLLLPKEKLLANDTACVVIAGNLDASSSIIISIPAVPGASFSDLDQAAAFSTNLSVKDSLAASHTASVYFFHTGSNQWQANAYVDAGEVGGHSGNPALIGGVTIGFDGGGNKTVPATSPDFVANSVWSNGSNASSIDFTFAPLTQLATSSSISDITTDCSTPRTCEKDSGLDFDGDGCDDLSIWRPRLGLWAVRLSSNDQLLSKQWGLPNDIPIAGDYTGDGKADLVTWRPSNGNWYICASSTNFDDCPPWDPGQQFGLPGDQPIRMDYDGDGTLDLTVWRESENAYYNKASSSGIITRIQWGLSGDIPLGRATATNN